MNEKKIFQQKILARVLLVCSGVIFFTSYLSNRIGNATVFAWVFMVVGIFTLLRAKKAEERLKN